MSDEVLVAGQLKSSVRSLLDRLDGAGVDAVTSLFTAGSASRWVSISPPDVAAAVRPYTWLIQRLGPDGLKLTSAGLLPPTVVEEAVKALDLDRDWVGKGNREAHTRPARTLRESAVALGLVRKRNGFLLATKTGDSLSSDPFGLWRFLADRTPVTRHDAEREAGQLLLLLVASGTPLSHSRIDGFLVEGLSSLGWQQSDRQPLTYWQAFGLARGTYEMLQRVGGLRLSFGSEVPQKPSTASMAFARAALRESPP